MTLLQHTLSMIYSGLPVRFLLLSLVCFTHSQYIFWRRIDKIADIF